MCGWMRTESSEGVGGLRGKADFRTKTETDSGRERCTTVHGDG